MDLPEFSNNILIY